MPDLGTFRVPWAVSEDGDLVPASLAIPGDLYRCPGCGSLLALKAGKIKVKHFAHRGGSGCSGESALHAAAKRRVFDLVNDWLHGSGRAPRIVGECTGSEWWYCEMPIHHPLNREKIDDVGLEIPIGDLRPDVVLFGGGKPRLAIEILVGHKVDEIKRIKSNHLWLELEAEGLLNNPFEWKPVQHNLPKLDRCDFCLCIDHDGLKLRIEELIKAGDRWVAKAKNPEAARRYLDSGESWLSNKIDQEFHRDYERAAKQWWQTHIGPLPAPPWGCTDDSEDMESDTSHTRNSDGNGWVLDQQ